MKNQILDAKAIKHKITRLAFEILEHHHKEDAIVLVGIEGQGYLLADKLAKELNKQSMNCQLLKLSIDKHKESLDNISLEPNTPLAGKVALLVDDVINSGGTMMRAASFLTQQSVRELKTAVLVNRLHRKFPINANYVGLSLSTTLREHIQVDLSAPGEEAAYLK